MNNYIYPGDVLKYHVFNLEMTRLGFKLNDLYVTFHDEGNLVIVSSKGRKVTIYDGSDFTYFSDHVTKVNNAQVLPVGRPIF